MPNEMSASTGGMRQDLQVWQRFIRAESHVLREHPQLLFQQAANQPDRTPASVKAKRLWESGIERRPWLHWVNKPQQLDPCLLTLTGHTDEVSGCVFCPDGEHIVTGTTGYYTHGELKIWNVKTGELVACLEQLWSRHQIYAMSQDARWVVTGKKDLRRAGELDVWEVETGRKVVTLPFNCGAWARSCGFSPDGRVLAVGLEDGIIRLFATDRWEEALTIDAYHSAVVDCAFSQDGRLLASVGLDANHPVPTPEFWARVSEARVKREREIAPNINWEGQLRSFVPPSLYDTDTLLKVWDTKTGECVARSGIITWTAEARISWSKDSSRIACGAEKETRIWSASTWTELKVIPGSGVLSPNGQLLLTGYASNTSSTQCCSLWSTDNSALVASLEGHGDSVLTYGFSPDGHLIVTGSKDHTVKVWDTAALLSSAKPPSNEYPYDKSIRTCLFSPDQRTLLWGPGSDEGIYELTDVNTCEKISEVRSIWHAPVAFSPDGSRLACQDLFALTIVDFQNRNEDDEADEISIGFDHGTSSFSPDGKQIVCGGRGELGIWDAGTGERVLDLKPADKKFFCCAYSPDGRLIAAGTSVGQLMLWNADSGTQIAAASHPKAVGRCVFSHDGRLILSACLDSKLRLWDTGTLEEVAILRSGFIVACAFSPDGRYVVSIHNDRTLKVWDIEHGLCEATFYTPNITRVLAVKSAGYVFAEGGDGGPMCLLRWMGIEAGPPIVTILLYSLSGRGWEEQSTARCGWCGERFVPPPTVIDAIQQIARAANFTADQSPCVELPDEVWEEPRLLAGCPHCHQPLKFNPFVVDNRDRY